MKLIESIKKIYTKEYWILLGIGFLPFVWKVLEIALFAGLESSIKVLGQIALIGIIFKVFEETLINPLYKIFNAENYKDDNEKPILAKKFLVYYAFAVVVFTAIIFALIIPIMKVSKVPENIFNETVTFLRVYIVASGVNVVSKYLYTFSVITKQTKQMLVYFITKAVFTSLLFVILIPKFSFGLGAMGVAIAELIVGVATIVYLAFKLPKTENKQIDFNKKEYFALMGYCFAETIIRNVVYYFVILVMLNMLDNQNLYFVANEYIWSLLLVPTLAQSTLIKQNLAQQKDASLKDYFINSVLLILFMIVLLPLALFVFSKIYNLANYMDYFYVLLKLFPCYIVFVFDSVIEAYFISAGKMLHILIQNLITNILIYLTAYICYLCGVWVVTLDTLILLFNLGVIVSSIYTIVAFIVIKNKENKSRKTQ